jgi:hypothetical protein
LALVFRFRDGQAQQHPPFDSPSLSTGKRDHVRSSEIELAVERRPWCLFDLAEIKLYRGDAQGFLDTAMRGFEHTEHDWQGKTFVDSLRLLLPAAGELPGLKEGLAELERLVPPQPA